MKFSVDQVMGLQVMQSAKVRTAKESLGSRPVESVSVIEIPVEDFVRKNELVLSTAIGCDDAGVFKKFVTEIYESEAAGLLLATGRHVTEIPPEVLSFAEDRQFPIIEVPWETRFADITHAVLSELHHWQQAAFERSEDLQKRLLNLFLNGDTLTAAAEAIHQAIGSPVVILDQDGAIKAKSKLSNLLADTLRRDLRPLLSPSDDLHTDLKPVHIGELSAIPLKIQLASQTFGYLLFHLPSESSAARFLSDGKETVLLHSITAIALWFQRERAILETEMRLKDDFVWSLTKGDVASWDMVFSRAKTLGYNLDLSYVCIQALPENLEAIYQGLSTPPKSYEHWIYNTVRSIEEQMNRVGETLKRQTMITYQRDRFIIFLEYPKDQIQNTVTTFLDYVENRLQKEWPGLIVSWGIGENHAGVRTFKESYNDARIALEIGIRQKGPGHRTTYANTSFFRAIIKLASIPEMQEIMLSAIGSLIDYDKHRGMELIATLTSYIRNNRNVSQTSRELNLHRQSLLYRLNKIESLTGRSLVDPDDLFLFDLSIKLWTTGMIEKKAGMRASGESFEL